MANEGMTKLCSLVHPSSYWTIHAPVFRCRVSWSDLAVNFCGSQLIKGVVILFCSYYFYFVLFFILTCCWLVCIHKQVSWCASTSMSIIIKMLLLAGVRIIHFYPGLLLGGVHPQASQLVCIRKHEHKH
jgi:hypothetical protein